MKLLVSGSGSAATKRSKEGLPQEIVPSGGFFLTTRRRASAASPPVLEGLGVRLLVIDDVLGGLDDDPARRVEACPPGAPGDLVELTGLEEPRLLAVILRQSREDHGADRDVDPDPERVGAADDLEQASLRQGLDKPAVLGQHAGVMDADPVPH